MEEGGRQGKINWCWTSRVSATVPVSGKSTVYILIYRLSNYVESSIVVDSEVALGTVETGRGEMYPVSRLSL